MTVIERADHGVLGVADVSSVGMPPPGWSGRGIGRCGDVVVGCGDASLFQSPPFSVTVIRAAFSSTMAWFLASAAVRGLIARLFRARRYPRAALWMTVTASVLNRVSAWPAILRWWLR